MIAALGPEDPLLHAFQDAKRTAEGESHFVRMAGRYPLNGRGDINTYAVFAELARHIISRAGRAGIIVPTGIATDDTTKYFFRDAMDSGSLVSLYGFENEEFIFPSVHHATKFCLLTMGGTSAPQTAAEFAFFVRQPGQLAEEQRRFRLSSADIALINPNTRTCPIFRSRRDAEITKRIYRRVPVLIDESRGAEGNPWDIRFLSMFHMANDSGLFRTCEELEAQGLALHGNVFVRGDERYLPLYEAKMMHQFDHRLGTYTGQTPAQANQGTLPRVTAHQHTDAGYVVMPRYWVPASEVTGQLEGVWDAGWFIGWRGIARATDRRTIIAAAVPRTAAGDTLLLMLPTAARSHAGALVANLDAFVCDYVSRQKLGGSSLKYFTMRQIAVLSPGVYDAREDWTGVSSLREWVTGRVLELVYTSDDVAPFARDLGYDGPPFVWDEARRFELRCELDAAFFHLYGIERDDVDYIMDTFWIVKGDDEKRFGEYRTKRRILELYDEYASARE